MTETAELARRIGLAKGQIIEALGDLATMSDRHPAVYHAERALRRALITLNGSEAHEDPTKTRL